MNQPQPSPEFSWDASLRQALSALRDCLEEARHKPESLELLDRDILLEDLRACYRIISAWPTEYIPAALPGVALPGVALPGVALPGVALPGVGLPAATDEPLTDEPLVDEAGEDEPLTEGPLVDEAGEDEPLTEGPLVDEAGEDEPLTEGPLVDESGEDEPLTEGPLVDEAGEGEPLTYEPLTYEPLVDEAGEDEPLTEEPLVDEAGEGEPLTYEPLTYEPLVDEAGEDEPLTEEPLTEGLVGERKADENRVDDFFSGDVLDPAMQGDLSAADLGAKQGDVENWGETTATQIEWIVGDPPLEEDEKYEEPSVSTHEENSQENSAEANSDEDRWDKPVDSNQSEHFHEPSDAPSIELDGKPLTTDEHTFGEVHIDETEGVAKHEPAIETGGLAGNAASNEAETTLSEMLDAESQISMATTAEITGTHTDSSDRAQRAEWYTPSLFELSDTPPASAPQPQEVGGSTSRIEQMIQSSKEGAARLADARLRPVSDIKKALGLNEKFLLMRSFFNNDAMRFTADLDRLNRLNSMQEAEEMLFGSLLPGRNWDAQSEADLTLFLIIYRRFSAR